MPRFDELPADQRAVLQLLLKQGKTYDDIAALLRLDREAVRERALDALDALGPETATGLDGDRQDEIADHLLLQQTASERQSTRRFLEGSAPGRAWARVVAAELRPIAGESLPEIPAEGAEVEQAFDALAMRKDAEDRHERSSRLGGYLVLAAIVIVIVLGIILLVGGNDDDKTTADSDSPAVTNSDGTDGGSTGGTGATGTTGPPATFPQQQLNLDPPSGSSSKATGVAQIAGGTLALQAEGLAQDNRYLVWFYNSANDAVPIGFAQYQTDTKRIAGGIQGLPQEAEKYKYVVITRESADQVSKPTNIVLRSQAIKTK